MSRNTDVSTDMDDVFRFDLSTANSADLGLGDDIAEVVSQAPQVRVTFTSAEVGNGDERDAGLMTNQDARLAVRLQSEDAMGNLTGPISRLDDEGIRFVARGPATFDVRDLVSGAARGDGFRIVQLGTMGDDMYDESGLGRPVYVNAGMGDDSVLGGNGADFLVGGAGNDSLSGARGNDSFIGGGGDDQIHGGAGNDLAIMNLATDGNDMVNLGAGADQFTLSATGASQIRLTFTSAEVGNDAVRDSGMLANQDGGLAVRAQAEGMDGDVMGNMLRADDEGVRFVAGTAGLTFDVRDLVSGTERGDTFGVVQLGTHQSDRIDESGTMTAVYVNAGRGNDRVTGSAMDDFLVGGAGRDTLTGGMGDDKMIGGADADFFVFTAGGGDDMVLDFVSRSDRLDFRTLGIERSDLMIEQVGADTVVSVDLDGDSMADLSVTLTNVSDLVARDLMV